MENPGYKIPFRDLSVPDASHREQLLSVIDGVLRGGRLINGPEVEAFEYFVAERTGARHCVGETINSK